MANLKSFANHHRRWPKILAIGVVIFAYGFFRLYHHPQRVNFADDQGTLLMDTWQMWRQRQPLLVGPQVLTMGYDGRYFFHGPYVYYFLLPGMLIGHWQPLAGSITTIIWGGVGVVCLLQLGRSLKADWLGILLAAVYSSCPMLTTYTSFIWNPNLLPPLVAALALLLVSFHSKTKSLNPFLIGLLTGVGLLLHYQVVLLIPMILLVLILKKGLTLKNQLLIVIGGLVGLAPMIIFELKHDFYNLKTVEFVLTHRPVFAASTPGYYYLAPIMLAVILIIVGIWQLSSVGLKKVILILTTGSAVGSIVWGATSLKPNPKIISLPELMAAAEIINHQAPTKFNVANLTTGNTRANALRYILTYQGLPPFAIDKYPICQQLYVLSSWQPATEISANPVWEISSFGGTVTDSWQLAKNGHYYLYQLDKNQNK